MIFSVKYSAFYYANVDTRMVDQDQQTLLDALSQQALAQKRVDRILKIVLPIMSLLITTICANMTWQSTLGTLIMLTVAFYAVGIKRWSIWLWLVLTALYCVIDNYLTFGTLQLKNLRLQMLGMLPFLIIIYMARPYLDKFMLQSKK